MSGMVERVAFILLDRGIDEPDHKNIAREIIEAMREPTDQMEQHVEASLDYVWSRRIWQDMIDTALRETTDA